MMEYKIYVKYRASSSFTIAYIAITLAVLNWITLAESSVNDFVFLLTALVACLVW